MFLDVELGYFQLVSCIFKWANNKTSWERSQLSLVAGRVDGLGVCWDLNKAALFVSTFLPSDNLLFGRLWLEKQSACVCLCFLESYA